MLVKILTIAVGVLATWAPLRAPKTTPMMAHVIVWGPWDDGSLPARRLRVPAYGQLAPDMVHSVRNRCVR